ncbi:MAG TPA: TCP-1/cpn60 chaperonin family protein, partial [Candidatus Bathyarchaeia archaeon]
GAVETELAKRTREYATKIGGREQLAVEAFADAMEVIPRTLADNAGLDQIDILVGLRAAHETKGVWSGINVYNGEIVDMWKEGVLEPLKVKEHAIGSAVEVASMILRIDDVIAASKPPPMPKGAGGPPME